MQCNYYWFVSVSLRELLCLTLKDARDIKVNFCGL